MRACSNVATVGGHPSIRDFLLRRLASRLVEWVVAFVDGLRLLRGFGSLRTVSVLGRSIQNLHHVGHDFDCGAFIAFKAFPLPGLQTTFQVNVSALAQVFTADLSQPTDAHDIEPLHPLPWRTFWVFPPFVDGKAKGTDGFAWYWFILIPACPPVLQFLV